MNGYVCSKTFEERDAGKGRRDCHILQGPGCPACRYENDTIVEHMHVDTIRMVTPNGQIVMMQGTRTDTWADGAVTIRHRRIEDVLYAIQDYLLNRCGDDDSKHAATFLDMTIDTLTRKRGVGLCDEKIPD